MSRETFRSNNVEGRAYYQSGALLNRQARAHEAANLGVPYNTHQIDGTFRAATPPPGFVAGIAVITDAANTCADDPAPDSGIDAPCATVNKYLARFRWFDHSTQVWAEYDEELRLDASGYWEGLHLDAGAEEPVIGATYPTDASRSPSKGVGFGAIPVFDAGDVVPAYYDPARGWLIPIMSPPADVPLGEYFSTSVENIAADFGLVLSDQAMVGVSIEVQVPGGNWSVRDALCFRVPRQNVETGFWLDTRSGFLTVGAPNSLPQGTRFRLVAGHGVDYNLFVLQKRLRFVAAGRYSSSAYVSNKLGYAVATYGSPLAAGWSLVASVPGRYKDTPSVINLGGGVFEIDYLDENDGWLIGVDVSLTIGNEAPENESSVSNTVTVESASSQSSQTSVSSASSTSASYASWSTRSWSSWSSSSYFNSSSSSSSSSVTWSQTAVSTSSATWDNFCCVTLVSDVICDALGHVLRVCYRTICFPTIGGKTCEDGIGPEICYPCEEETTSRSSSSVSITSSSSSDSLTSSSPSSNSLTSTSHSSSSSSLGLSSSSSTSLGFSSSSITRSLSSVPATATAGDISPGMSAVSWTSFGITSLSTAVSAMSTSSLFFFLDKWLVRE